MKESRQDWESIFECRKCQTKKNNRCTQPCVLRIPHAWDSGTTLPTICIFGCGDKTRKAEWIQTRIVNHPFGWISETPADTEERIMERRAYVKAARDRW